MAQPVVTNKLFTDQDIAKLGTEKYSKISSDGIILEHNSKTYHIQMISGKSQKTDDEYLTFRVESNSNLFFQAFNATTQTNTFYGEREVSQLSVLDIITNGALKEDAEIPVFSGKLNEKYHELNEKFSTITSQKEEKEASVEEEKDAWTRNQKAGAALVALLAAATLAFSAKKLMNAKSWNPMNWGKMPETPAPAPIQMPRTTRSSRRR